MARCTARERTCRLLRAYEINGASCDPCRFAELSCLEAIVNDSVGICPGAASGLILRSHVNLYLSDETPQCRRATASHARVHRVEPQRGLEPGLSRASGAD